MEMDDQSFFAGDMSIRLLCPSFNKDILIRNEEIVWKHGSYLAEF